MTIKIIILIFKNISILLILAISIFRLFLFIFYIFKFNLKAFFKKYLFLVLLTNLNIAILASSKNSTNSTYST